MFHCTGWFDVCLDTTIHNWHAVQAQADAYTRQNARLLIGPWSHGGSFHADFDDTDFGAENTGAGQDVTGQMLNWFDRYLKDRQDAAVPVKPVRYYVIGENAWREDDTWPPSAAESVTMYLHTDGKLNTQLPGVEAADHYTYDPADPSPSFAPPRNGQMLQIGDYAPVADRADVLTWETEPLTEDMTIAGELTMHLYAETDARDTDFACRVLDVAPDGFARQLNAGLIRGKWRKGFFCYEPVRPGQAEQYDIEIGNAAWQLKAGHRLQIQVCSALFPLYDRNLNTGEPSWSCDHAVAAHQRILHDAAHPSCLVMPVIR